MKIYDCITYFDEDLILELRLNILYDHIDKFIISEGTRDHRGKKRVLNFEKEKFSKFLDKIIYIPVDNFPNLSDPWSMLRFQRNSSMKYLVNLMPEDYVIVSDVDEIPNPDAILNFIKKNKDIGVFEQLFFYYKLNLQNITTPFWFGSKICKIKAFKNPDWLRAYKPKQYPWWRIDKPKNLDIISNGGWHFSFLYDVDGIIKKISSYQHTEFDIEEIKNREILINKISQGDDIFNRGYKFKKIHLDHNFPKYLLENKLKYIKWIQI